METLQSNSQIAVCERHFYEGLRPPPDFTISEWSDKHRRLPKEASSEPGQWRTSRTPYLREIMDELSPSSHTTDIVFMKGTQVGATEVIINFALYKMAQDPSSMLIVQPTINVAERFSKQRLQPSIDECTELRNKVTDGKSRDGSNTILMKAYPGGVAMLGGANSAASLRSMPVPNILQDEVDGYPGDVDGEGDPSCLADKRSTNFPRRKRYYSSTPTIAGSSRIEKKFNESDQRYYFVPCPFCGHMQVIKWDNIKYSDNNPDTVYLECENEECRKPIHERYKTQMLAGGKWIKQNLKSKIAGFHLSAFYSPIGWYSWANAVEDHLKAIGDILLRKVWVNTVLGETWEESATTIDAHWLMKRQEKYTAIVPEGVVVLSAGADTQDDRLECTVLGWGVNNECWIIEHQVFRGDPAQDDVWNLLDSYLTTEFQHESGIFMQIGCVCIDAMGHHTDEVYAFCKARAFRRVFPVQGRGGAGKPLVGKATLQKRERVYLFQIGTDQAKNDLYSRLKITDEGPGYIHFPEHLDEDYFKRLTAEKRIMTRVGGLPRSKWECPKGRRNESLDCYVYGMAALKILNPNIDQLAAEQKLYTPQFRKTNVPRKRGWKILNKGVRV